MTIPHRFAIDESGSTSSGTAVAQFNEQVRWNTNDFDGTLTCYIECTMRNSHATNSYGVELWVNGTTQGVTTTCPPNASATVYRSASFTPTAGDNTYKFRIQGTPTAGQLIVYTITVVVLQQTANTVLPTKMARHVCIGTFSGNLDAVYPTTFLYQKSYLHQSSAYDAPTITAYADIQMRTLNTTGQNLKIVIQRDTNGDQTNWVDVVTVVENFHGTAVGFSFPYHRSPGFTLVDGCNYRISFGRTGASGLTQSCRGSLYIVQSGGDISKTEEELCVQPFRHQATGVSPSHRMFYYPGEYVQCNQTNYWEQFNAHATGDGALNTVGTGDVTNSRISHSTAVRRYRSGAITLPAVNSTMAMNAYVASATATINYGRVVQHLRLLKISPATITRSLQFRVKRPATNIVRSLQFVRASSVTPVTIVRSLLFRVKTPTTLTRSLLFRVRRPATAITRSLLFRVRTSATPFTRSLIFRVRVPATVLTRVLLFRVRRPATTITRALLFRVRTGATITRSLLFRVRRATSMTRSLLFRIRSGSALTRSLLFRVKRGTSITKSLLFRVRSAGSITKALLFRVKPSVTIVRSLLFRVRRPGANITKTLLFRVRSVVPLTRVLSFKVRIPASIVKDLQFIIYRPVSTVNIIKPMQFLPKKVYSNGYIYRRLLTPNKTHILGGVAHTYQGFAHLIDITQNDLKHTSYGGKVININGYDIRFEPSTGSIVKLNHEIEAYDPTTGRLRVWIQKDLENLSSGFTTISNPYYMYYGNPNQTTTEENPTGVWDTNYKAVLHFNNNLNDSTSNAYHGTNSGSTNATGIVVNGRDFDGTDDVVTLPAGASISGNNPFSMEMWVNVDQHTQRTFMSWGANTTNNKNALRMYATGLYHYFWGNDTQIATSSFVGGWVHVAITYDGTTRTIFVNGSAVHTNNPSAGVNVTASIVTIGNSAGLSEFFDGRMDEARISSIARLPRWITTHYRNIQNATAFVTVGTEQSNFYGVTADQIIRSLRFTVKRGASLVKSLAFRVRTGISFIKSLSFRVKPTAVIIKSLKFTTKAGAILTRLLTFRVKRSGTNIVKEMEFSTNTISIGYIAKTLSFKVRQSPTFTKIMRFTVKVSGVVFTKAMQFRILAYTVFIAKSLTFRIRKTVIVQRVLGFIIKIFEIPFIPGRVVPSNYIERDGVPEARVRDRHGDVHKNDPTPITKIVK